MLVGKSRQNIHRFRVDRSDQMQRFRQRRGGQTKEHGFGRATKRRAGMNVRGHHKIVLARQDHCSRQRNDVQIIEFVTGKPRTLKSAGGAAGTSSAAGSAVCAVAFAGLEIAPLGGLPVADCGDVCAFTLAAKIAARNAQTKMMVPNCFTQKRLFKQRESPVWSNRIAGLKGRKDCLAVEKFTSTFWNFLA